jgi:transcriptional regulator with XRE-family HTH domain
MPRPPKLVKNELSLAIGELRRRLGYSQQSFANSLDLSMGAVARWELNQRPQRALLKRLIDLASNQGFKDLTEVFYAEYRREFGLSYDMEFHSEAAAAAALAIQMLDGLPQPKKQMDRHAKQLLRELLERLQAKISEFPTDPTDVKIITPPKKGGNR